MTIDSANIDSLCAFIIGWLLAACFHRSLFRVSLGASSSCNDSGMRQLVNAAHAVTLTGLICLQACQKEQVM